MSVGRPTASKASDVRVTFGLKLTFRLNTAAGTMMCALAATSENSSPMIGSFRSIAGPLSPCNIARRVSKLGSSWEDQITYLSHLPMDPLQQHRRSRTCQQVPGTEVSAASEARQLACLQMLRPPCLLRWGHLGSMRYEGQWFTTHGVQPHKRQNGAFCRRREVRAQATHPLRMVGRCQDAQALHEGDSPSEGRQNKKQYPAPAAHVS